MTSPLDLPAAAAAKYPEPLLMLPSDSTGYTPPDPVVPRRRYFALISTGEQGLDVQVFRRHVPRERREGEVRGYRPSAADLYRTVDSPETGDLLVAQAQGKLTREQALALGDPVAEYRRNYRAMYSTFEPFRQRIDGQWRDLALISDSYVRTAVLDLHSGQVIATQAPPMVDGEPRPAFGFCPVEFYVVDFWDRTDGTVLPDSKYWKTGREEQFDGTFGFVAGCVWGDDGSWKLQHLDLSRIDEGVVVGDDRFGYVQLPHGLTLAEAVSVYADQGSLRVSAAVEIEFDLRTGEPDQDSLDGLVNAQARHFVRPADSSAASSAAEGQGS